MFLEARAIVFSYHLNQQIGLQAYDHLFGIWGIHINIHLGEISNPLEDTCMPHTYWPVGDNSA